MKRRRSPPIFLSQNLNRVKLFTRRGFRNEKETEKCVVRYRLISRPYDGCVLYVLELARTLDYLEVTMPDKIEMPLEMTVNLDTDEVTGETDREVAISDE